MFVVSMILLTLSCLTPPPPFSRVLLYIIISFSPNNFKQKYEVFTNNGLLNSLYVIFNTPGAGNVVRVTNLAPLEFPCKAFIASV